MSKPLRQYSARLDDALALAVQLHHDQLRKGTSIPYVSHLVAVAALVMEDGGDEDEVIAALLHDAVEDQEGSATAALIREEFGAHVADVVLSSVPTQRPRKARRRVPGMTVNGTISPHWRT